MTFAEWTRLKDKAQYITQKAVKNGILPRLKENIVLCVDCGKRATGYDHRDYRKPLKVAPVCQRCNVLRGPDKTSVMYGHSHAKPNRFGEKIEGIINMNLKGHSIEEIAIYLDLSRERVRQILKRLEREGKTI